MLKKTFEQQPTMRIPAQRSITLSLDVFDTTLIRKTTNRELFRRLGEKVSAEWTDWELGCDEFAHWRRVSEERANREHGNGRFVLGDVYKHFTTGHPLSESQIHRLMEMELELEAAHLTAVPEMREKIEHEHENGRSVLFLSDMYLPSDWLCDILRAHGLWQDGDELFVSGEAKASKSRGDLFALAEQELGARLSKPIHFGDNPWSDVSQAKASGWRAELFSTALPTKHEALLASHSGDYGDMPEVLAAAARIARLRMARLNPSELGAHLGVATAIAAPILVAYAIWILRKAKTLGLKRLYFMTRDGLVPHRVFLELIKKVAPDEAIDVRVLAASRQVCRLSGIDPEAHKLPDWVTYNPHQITVTSCLFRVGLKPTDFEAQLTEIGFSARTWEQSLEKKDVERLRQFLHYPSVKAKIHVAAENAKANYEEYLRDAGLYDGVSAGIVDIGWRGSTFHSLVSRLPEEKRGSLHLLPFGFLGDRYDGLNGHQIHSYYCDNWRGQGEIGGDHLVTVMEDFVAVEEGTLTGIIRDRTGRVRPQFREVVHSDRTRRRLAINKNAPVELVRALSKSQLDAWCVDRMTPVWKKLIDEFWNNPSDGELLEFSEHKREVDQSGHVSVKLAKAYSWTELIWWLGGLRPLDPGLTCWPAGRRALTTGWRRHALNLGDWFHGCWPGYARRMCNQKKRWASFIGRYQ